MFNRIFLLIKIQISIIQNTEMVCKRRSVKCGNRLRTAHRLTGVTKIVYGTTRISNQDRENQRRVTDSESKTVGYSFRHIGLIGFPYTSFVTPFEPYRRVRSPPTALAVRSTPRSNQIISRTSARIETIWSDRCANSSNAFSVAASPRPSEDPSSDRVVPPVTIWRSVS